MSPEDFAFIAKLLKERSGLAIAEDKLYLLESRLMPVVRKNGFNNIEDLIISIKGKNIALAEEVTEAMTTNESFFFRDIKPFEQFKQIVLPAMLKERAIKKTIRIWCAACSSGQEPYSLAMILNEEKAKLQGWRIEIIGTDISKEILQKAKDGRYSQFEVQRGLPINLLVKYFDKQDDTWLISREICSMVNYKYWNLLDDIKPLGIFDVIFCRNVLIYFDHPTKSKVLAKIANQVASDGFLYLGGAETVLGVSNRFKPVPGQRGVYIVNADGNDVIPSSFVPNTPQAAAPMVKKSAPEGVAAIKASSAPPPKPMPLSTAGITKTAPPVINKQTTVQHPPAGKPPAMPPTIRPPQPAAPAGIKPVGIKPAVTPSNNAPASPPVPRPTPPTPNPNTVVQHSSGGGTVVKKVIIKKVIKRPDEPLNKNQ